MGEPIGLTVAMRPRERLVRVAEMARRQGGVIGRRQLYACGADDPCIRRWIQRGHLHRIHPAVYAVGHKHIGLRGKLVAALAYAGPDAALSHQTAAYIWELLPTRPSRVHITSPRDRRSLPAIAVHRATLAVVERNGFPVTTVERTLLDLAALMSYPDLRRAVAEADFHNLLDPSAVLAECGRGRTGSTPLRAALLAHLPELARANEGVEQAFLLLCERCGIPIPEVNVYVEGFKVDCLWRDRRVIVELDSRLAHSQPAKVAADRDRDLTLRLAGYEVRRYTWHQVTATPETVIADLRAALA